MTNSSRTINRDADNYEAFGFSVLRVFGHKEALVLERFAKGWIYRLLGQWIGGREDEFPLETYHLWSETLGVDHGNVFCAKNRHTRVSPEIRAILLNEKVNAFLNRIGVDQFRFWDEGLGELAFRFIRPGAGDGYPFTRKEWGIAKKVISCWVPIIGMSSKETLTVVPGSHRKEYQRTLPTDHPFRKDEYRLAEPLAEEALTRPELNAGDVIFYHPRTIHCEDVLHSDVTRLNLEFRLDPVEVSRVSGMNSL